MTQAQPIQVWRFEDAPEDLRLLSPHGGDEDWLIIVPAALADTYINWMEGPAFHGGISPSRHEQADGSVVVIVSH